MKKIIFFFLLMLILVQVPALAKGNDDNNQNKVHINIESKNKENSFLKFKFLLNNQKFHISGIVSKLNTDSFIVNGISILKKDAKIIGELKEGVYARVYGTWENDQFKANFVKVNNNKKEDEDEKDEEKISASPSPIPTEVITGSPTVTPSISITPSVTPSVSITPTIEEVKINMNIKGEGVLDQVIKILQSLLSFLKSNPIA